MEILRRYEQKILELKSTITKTKNSLHDSKADLSRQKKDQEIRRLDNGNYVVWGTERKKIEKIEQSLRKMWDTFKHMNIYVMEILWGEEKETEITLEGIMVEKFPTDEKL